MTQINNESKRSISHAYYILYVSVDSQTRLTPRFVRLRKISESTENCSIFSRVYVL